MSENNVLVKRVILGVSGLALIAFVALFYFRPMLMRGHLPKPVVINTVDQPTIGDSDAKVHIVVFEDLKCVNCARFSNEMMPYIKKQYLDTGVAKYTMINLAFIKGSMPAANAAHCLYAQNPAFFFPFIENIFQNQPPENQNWATIPTLMDFASKIPGVDINQLTGCLVKNTYDPLIQNNLKQAMAIMNGSVATPAVFVNGVRVMPATKAQLDAVIAAVK